jgi:hypothetical protein
MHRQTVSPLLVVELDDSSHQRIERRNRDLFVDRALAAAGLPILHVTAKGSYVIEDIANSVKHKITRL